MAILAKNTTLRKLLSGFNPIYDTGAITSSKNITLKELCLYSGAFFIQKCCAKRLE
jgi:hypothetical protein